jgi:hypothetical protein
MKKKIFYCLLCAAALCPACLFGQIPALKINPDDLHIEQGLDGGFHLYIRKKPELNSVLLLESVRDPEFREPNYAYRAAEWNAVNGDETRLLDGKPLSKEAGVWSLIDSTPEKHSEYGEVFHVYIPYTVSYGYENTRHDTIYVGEGTYFNIRAFALPFADYNGAFQDNSYLLTVTQKPLPGPPEGNYMPLTVTEFTKISQRLGGNTHRSGGGEAVMDTIRAAMPAPTGKSLDLVLCIDATASMVDEMAALRSRLVPFLREMSAKYPGFRVGMVLYKDYNDEYVTFPIKFETDLNLVQRSLNGIKVGGGRDIPEAVYEALYDAAQKFDWSAQERMVMLIGDAPPHPKPRGKITEEMAMSALNAKQIKVSTIILPQ